MTINDSDSRLAIHGGPKAVATGPPVWPLEDDDVLQALQEVYQSGDWGHYHGQKCEQLSEELRNYFSTEHVQLCCSGTFAVELALRSLHVAEGDEVVMAGYDFSANFRAIEATGAMPVLVDVEPQTWCLDAEQLAAAIGEKTKAILVSHLHGGLANLAKIVEVAKEFNVKVIEDICQSPGTKIDDQLVGTFGDVAVMSFGGSKLLSAGRGGAVLTSDSLTAQRAKIFCQRGNDAFPLSELQAAVLIPQLKKLDQRNLTRSANVKMLRSLTSDLSLFRPLKNQHSSILESFYKLPWALQNLRPEVTREELIAAAQAEGIALDVGFRGFSGRSQRRCRKVGDLNQSQYLAENTVLLHHPVLLHSEQVIRQVAAGLQKIDQAYRKES